MIIVVENINAIAESEDMMSYCVKIQLCDDDSVITDIETEVKNIEQGEQLVGVLSTQLEHYYKKLSLSCDDCKKCGETTCGNDINMRCFEPIQ